MSNYYSYQKKRLVVLLEKKKNTFKTIFVDSMIWWQRFKEPFGITGVDDIYGHHYLLSGSSIKTLPDTRASGTSLWWKEGRVRTVFWRSWFCCANIWVQGGEVAGPGVWKNRWVPKRDERMRRQPLGRSFRTRCPKRWISGNLFRGRVVSPSFSAAQGNIFKVALIY